MVRNLAAVTLLALAAWLAACGRTSEDALFGQGDLDAGADASLDARADADASDAQTDAHGDARPDAAGDASPGDAAPDTRPPCVGCAGCCDAAGTCLAGDAPNACGLGGVACLPCAALGFDCVSGACRGVAPVCDASTCSGCCDAQGLCRDGTQVDACGAGAAACVSCGALGCVSGSCQGAPPTCGPATCGGCCDASGTCVAGDAPSACGAGGAACVACTASGAACDAIGGYCTYVPPCSASTCPAGCCDARGVCQSGRTDLVCGAGGQGCHDCAASGQACAASGYCYAGAHCGADTCAGCCDGAGTCQPGTTVGACGAFGSVCTGCAAGSSCTAFACDSGSTCPAPYAGCSPSALVLPPAPSTSCTAVELDAIAVACKGPDPGQPCFVALQKLLVQNAACQSCLLQFTGNDAYARCLAPYLTASCNHELTCAVECSDAVCGQCATSQKKACSDALYSSGEACAPFTAGVWCASAALGGPGAFCDYPKNQDAGQWLRTVGEHYCR